MKNECQHADQLINFNCHFDKYDFSDTDNELRSTLRDICIESSSVVEIK